MDASAKMADSTFIQCHLQADGQSYPTLPQHIYHKARHETHYRKVMVIAGTRLLWVTLYSGH